MQNLEKGQHIFIAFQSGKAVLDSQLQPLIYTSLENVERYTPTFNRGKIEYVEYAPTTTQLNELLTLQQLQERTLQKLQFYAELTQRFFESNSDLCPHDFHWIRTDLDGTETFECSVCGKKERTKRCE